jgi:hypothetical protein
MSPERNFSFQNGNLSVSVCHGAEEAEAQEPRKTFGGRGFKWGSWDNLMAKGGVVSFPPA